MKKRSRLYIIVILSFLFLIAAPLSIFYSLGWRIDLKNRKLIQVGFLFVKAWPKSAEIYLNGESAKKTDFFFGSALVEDLSPGTYAIEIKKEGFQDWKKNLEVKKRQVTEIKDIILVTKNPKFGLVSVNADNFYVSNDEKMVIIKEKSENPETKKMTWDLKLFEVESNIKSQLVGEKDVAKNQNAPNPPPAEKTAELFDLRFSPDSKSVLLDVVVQEKINHYILTLDRTPPILTPLSFLDPEPGILYFNPQDANSLFLFADGKINAVDIPTKKISVIPLAEKISAISILQDNIYYLDDRGFVFKSNFSFSSKEQLNVVPLGITNENAVEINSAGSNVFLRKDKTLYWLDEQIKTFEKIQEAVENIAISENNNKIGVADKHGIWVFFPEGQTTPTEKIPAEISLLFNSPEEISNVSWWTDDYLMVGAEGKIKIVETDDRDELNVVTLAEFLTPLKISWNQRFKNLLVLSRDNLFISDRIGP